jgi:thioredoxin 1
MNMIENNNKQVQIDNGSFDSEVLESKLPVVVAFVTPWSRPCAVIAPVLDEIATENAGKLKVVCVNADANPDLSLWYDVQSIPTLLYFVAGNVRSKIVGTASKEAILSKFEAVSEAASKTSSSAEYNNQ